MDQTSHETNALRAGARKISLDALAAGPCCTCGKPASSPYRRTGASGQINVGCVDAHHSGHVSGPDLAWHVRAEASAIRAATLRGLSR